jgi:hypothetical protein
MNSEHNAESPANVAGRLGITDYIERCTELDGETVGEYFEQNWNFISGNTQAMAYLMREMKRKFKLRDRHKQVDGTYKKIRGFTSFEKWFVHATGKSVRAAYYALKSEEKKHKTRRAEFQFDSDYVRACVARIQKTLKPLESERLRYADVLAAVIGELEKLKRIDSCHLQN